MSAPDFELPPVEAPFPVPSMDPTTPPGDPVAADGGVLIMPAAGVDQPPEYVPQAVLEAMRELGSASLNLIPVVGQVKAGIEAVTGEDLVTGEHLAWWERALDVAVAVSPPEAEEEEEAVRLVKLMEEIHELAEKVHQFESTKRAVEAIHEGNEIKEHADEMQREANEIREGKAPEHD